MAGDALAGIGRAGCRQIATETDAELELEAEMHELGERDGFGRAVNRARENGAAGRLVDPAQLLDRLRGERDLVPPSSPQPASRNRR